MKKQQVVRNIATAFVLIGIAVVMAFVAVYSIQFVMALPR
jgi:hypothetical protein